MPTPLVLNGFENQVMAVGGNTTGSLWGAITGTASATEGTIFRGAGARSMKTAIPASAFQSSMAGTTYAAQTRIAARFYFRKSGNPSTAVRIFDSAHGGSIFYSIDLNTSGQLFLNVTGGTGPVDGSVTAALTDNQWYLVDMVFDGSTTAYVGRLWLDGTAAVTDATTTAVGAASNTRVILGVVNSVTLGVARDIYFDDLIVGTASGITDKFGATDGIVGLLPSGDGTHSPAPPTAGQFKDVGGTDISGGNPAFDNLDSGVLTQTAERISMDTASSTNYLEMAFGTTTLSAAAPVMVQGEAALNSSGTLAFTNGSTRMENGGVETVIFTGDWSTATQWYKIAKVAVADQTELDGLLMRIGYCTAQPDIPYWMALMYEVDIGKGVAATPSLVYQPALQPHRTGR